MALTKITKTGLGAGAVDSNKIEADSIDATKIADNAVSDEHLDITAITGQTELAESAAGSDVLLIYDASAGTLKKIQASNVGLQAPTISSVSPTNVLTGDGTGNATFTITGTGFTTGATASLITDGGSEVSFDSVTRDSDTQITGVIAISSLSNANEPYDVKVTLSNSLTTTLTNQINIDAQPTFVTASGSLGSQTISTAGSFSVNATDPDSAGNVTFELQSGSLPPGYTITNTGANGGTAIISGTDSTTSVTTVFNFVLRAVDAASNVSSRAFSITSSNPVTESFTSSGTFSVPSGITSIQVLVVGGGGGGGSGPGQDSPGGGGGGGGAGGLIFIPSYPVAPGGTITVTVGCGSNTPEPVRLNGGVGLSGQDSLFGSPGDPGLSPTGGVLTAKGGGGGGAGGPHPAPYLGVSGGSGGGSGGVGGPPGPGAATGPGGSATQPTQPGQSGAYGFGSAGGVGISNETDGRGGGGGGAGGIGQNAPGSSPFTGGPGGIGKAYTISDGTTPVYYAGGGGGSAGYPGGNETLSGGTGGQGGGGNGATYVKPYPGTGAQPGTANRGGGGGGGSAGSCGTSASFSDNGGKGIVIVRY